MISVVQEGVNPTTEDAPVGVEGTRRCAITVIPEGTRLCPVGAQLRQREDAWSDLVRGQTRA